MSLMCSYQDCLCVKYPCSRIAFFRLPTDNRRGTWIKNSGNKKLLNISVKAHRFFCENHFRECDIRTQFNRKLLTKYAVPIPHTIPAEDPEPKKLSNYSTSNYNNSEDMSNANPVNFVIEQVEDNANPRHFYEDETTPNFEDKEVNNMTEPQAENSYTLLDFYIPDNSDELEQNEEQLANQDELENEITEMYYVETSSNQVDSSTLDMNSDEDVENPVAVSKKQPLVLREENLTNPAFLESPNSEKVQVTTSNNDYQEDKHFALSLVGYFQRLPKGKKALAKLKILQYLTELEVGLSGNL